MPKAAATLSWSAASGTYRWSDQQGAERLSLLPDSPDWFAWLADLPSFGFQGQHGSYTARQERRGRDERYWYAYLRTGGQVRKKYLGKTAELTISRLEQVASILLTERLPGGLPAPTLPPTQETHQPKVSLPADPFSAQLSSLYRKLDVRSREEALAQAVRFRLL